MRESHMMNNQVVMLLPYFLSIRPDIVKLRSVVSEEDYMAIEFGSFLIEKSKLVESESTCSFRKEAVLQSEVYSTPVEYVFDILYDTESDYLSRLRPIFNIIMNVTKAWFQTYP